MMSSVEERVSRGAALLDLRHLGWVPQIDIDRLDIGSDGDCLFGQLYGEYEAAAELYFPGENVHSVRGNPARFGFFHDANDTPEAVEADYAALRPAWVAEIRKRLASVVLPQVVVGDAVVWPVAEIMVCA